MTADRERAFWDDAASADEARVRTAIWGETEPGAWEGRVPACLDAILPALRPAIDRAFHDRGAARVLDLGCGIGRLTMPTARAVPWATVVGVDVSLPMLIRADAEARRAGVENVEWLEGDGRRLPDVGALDAAFCMVVFQHMPWEAACGYIRDVAAALRPGGAFRFQVVEGERAEWMSNHVTEAAVRGACATAGLRVEAVDRGLLYDEWLWCTAVKPRAGGGA